MVLQEECWLSMVTGEQARGRLCWSEIKSGRNMVSRQRILYENEDVFKHLGNTPF